MNLSLDKLLNIEVTSVSKKAEKVSQAAASVYVVTSEDIRRTGITSIPEALRMVPGLNVSQLDSNKWAIGARGFSEEFTNKLLVLVDGRTAYSPLFAGVHWDVQDVLLEDIDRIEVIKGPGASLWGANAVNGVINIITKKAQDTQGVYVSGAIGNWDKSNIEARYGGDIGDNIHYRVYTKHFDKDNSKRSDGTNGNDEWDMGRGGFRVDIADFMNHEGDNLTVQGDVYWGEQVHKVESTVPGVSSFGDDELFGGNILARWNHALSENVDITVQAYYDRTERQQTLSDDLRNTFDIEAHAVWQTSERNTIVSGIGYRFIEDFVNNGNAVTLSPISREDYM